MLIGLVKITSGKVFYNEKDLTNNIKKAQEIIGIVGDESNLYDEMNGFDNLCFCGSLYGMEKEKREKKANELLELFSLTEHKKKRFKQYSKGMKRKLTIAAALMHDPQILFLDEPTTGIDVATVRQIRELIKKLNEKKTTIFMTTHYIDEAERLCDRVAFINNGEILKIDNVKNLINSVQEEEIIEVNFEHNIENKKEFILNFNNEFNEFKSSFINDNCIKVISNKKIDISPIISYLSKKELFINEAKIIKPSLEDAFVKVTGIEINMMKKEKEKK
jgi:ABC-2 type transport system ATP-binding protein